MTAFVTLPVLKPGFRYFAEDGKPDPTFLRHWSDTMRAIQQNLGIANSAGSLAGAAANDAATLTLTVASNLADLMTLVGALQDQINLAYSQIGALDSRIGTLELANLSILSRIAALESYNVAHP